MKMKNLKRVFSTALASVMALSLFTVPVSASKGAVVESIEVSKTINVNKNSSIPEETFSFTMEPATSDQIAGAKIGTVAVEPGLPLDDDTLEYTFSSTDTAQVVNSQLTKTGETFDVSELGFDHAGIYRYYVEESIPETREPYITYSETKYMIDLYVYAESDGSYKIRDMSVTKIDGETTLSVKPQNINFENTINTKDLTISKTVVGEEYTSGEEFDFWIEIPVGGDTIKLSPNAVIQAALYDANGLVKDSRTNNTGIVELKVNGDDQELEKATVASVKAAGTNFKLKNGEYLQISAPATMIYFVVEDDYAEEGYVQTYKYDEEGLKNTATKSSEESIGVANDAHNKVIKGTVNTATNLLEFINTREISNPNTGINLDMLPYVLLTLIAVCGGILFINRKRRVDR
jgi:hypothetical protein